MRITVRDGALEVDTSVPPNGNPKAEEWSSSYAIMRSGLVGGDGTTLTWVAPHRTRVVPARGNLDQVKAFMEREYQMALTENVIYLNEIDVNPDLSEKS